MVAVSASRANEQTNAGLFVHKLILKKQLCSPTFAAVTVPGVITGIKREVRCKSGAIPVAVSSVSEWSIVNGE